MMTREKTTGEKRRRLALSALIVCTLLSSACATVPKNRRAYLMDRTMAAPDSQLMTRAMRKFHTAREAASGGDGKSAGGGCGCAN